MKAALPLLIAMAFAGCAISQDTAVEAASPVGTFSTTSESGAILLLQVKEDHSYVLSEHGYGAKTAPPIEGRWTTKKEGIALDPVPSIGGTLNLTRDGPKMSLTNDRIRFEKITVPEPNHAVQRTSATPPSLT